MKELLELLKTLLNPIVGTSDKFAIQPCKNKANGFTAKLINHDVYDSAKLADLQTLIQSIKPDWEVKFFEESSSFNQKTGQKMTFPEKLWFGPAKSFDTDKSDEVFDLFS
jgi:hypothetical protein